MKVVPIKIGHMRSCEKDFENYCVPSISGWFVHTYCQHITLIFIFISRMH